MNELPIPAVRSRLATLDTIPCVPAILIPVLRQLSEPPESIDLQRVIELVAHDKALTAQTLRMANSPLFGTNGQVDSVRAAVLTLGLERMRAIATTCCVLRLAPSQSAHLDPRIFWEHSLGCALVARQLARRIGYADPEKAYLAGLLHDIGFIVNMMFFPEQFRQTLQRATREKVALGVLEQKIFGFDHCGVGELLAGRWLLGGDLQEVIRHHHMSDHAIVDRALVGIVAISDLLCRTSGLGYGYDEILHLDLKTDPSVKTVAGEFPRFSDLDWARFLTELQAYVKQVRDLVSVLYRTH
ncbi:MAG: HDOD domain-containing protein [Candidatus Korobacteraceae bacterium]